MTTWLATFAKYQNPMSTSNTHYPAVKIVYSSKIFQRKDKARVKHRRMVEIKFCSATFHRIKTNNQIKTNENPVEVTFGRARGISGLLKTSDFWEASGAAAFKNPRRPIFPRVKASFLPRRMEFCSAVQGVAVQQRERETRSRRGRAVHRKGGMGQNKRGERHRGIRPGWKFIAYIRKKVVRPACGCTCPPYDCTCAPARL